MRDLLSIIILASLLAGCATPRRDLTPPQSAPLKARVEKASTAAEETRRATVVLREKAPPAIREAVREVEFKAEATVREMEAVKLEVQAYEVQVQRQAVDLSTLSRRCAEVESRLAEAQRVRDKALNKLWFWRCLFGGAASLIAVGAYISLRK